MQVFRRAGLGLAMAAWLVAGTAARAEIVNFKADLNAQNEVPPNSSQATGRGEATLDTATRTLTWTITYTGLSGPAIGAHFHGPGEAGRNAGITLHFRSTASPINGSQVVTETQAAEILSGRWYINIHTERNPGGEIRGQLLR